MVWYSRRKPQGFISAVVIVAKQHPFVENVNFILLKPSFRFIFSKKFVNFPSDIKLPQKFLFSLHKKVFRS